MKISYKKLKILMVEYDLQLQDIKNNTGLSNNTMARINKGEYINIPSLAKMCEYLSNLSGRKINIGDIIDIEI